MKPTPSPTSNRLKARLSEMVALHLQATHLPHVRRYLKERERALSRDDKGSDLRSPRKGRTLRLYLTRLLRFDSIVDGSKDYSGWLQFLDWGNGLLGIADIHEAGEKSSLVSVSFGPSAIAQHDVLTQFFRSKVR